MNADPEEIITPELRSEFDALCTKYPEKRAALLPILHRVQQVHGFLSNQALEAIATYLELAPVEVLGVVSFYPMFRRAPIGRHRVAVCKNISCDLMGAEDIFAAIKKRFGVEAGETTADNSFTLEAVQCLGACGYGPMMDIDGTYHEHLTGESAVEILEDLIAKGQTPESKDPEEARG